MNENIIKVIDRLTDLLTKKNGDYGNSVFLPPPLAADISADKAILIRMGDKIQRLMSISRKKDYSVSDETFDDTLKDLAGYIILYFAVKEDAKDDGRCSSD